MLCFITILTRDFACYLLTKDIRHDVALIYCKTLSRDHACVRTFPIFSTALSYFQSCIQCGIPACVSLFMNFVVLILCANKGFGDSFSLYRTNRGHYTTKLSKAATYVISFFYEKKKYFNIAHLTPIDFMTSETVKIPLPQFARNQNN